MSTLNYFLVGFSTPSNQCAQCGQKEEVVTYHRYLARILICGGGCAALSAKNQNNVQKLGHCKKMGPKSQKVNIKNDDFFSNAEFF